ncbi:MAG TPA: hypothetical protein VFW39_01905, partial [Sphingomicrobium sp.]|nr:hypothetical protein [Sphingomicrobium sp.]
AAEQVVEDIHWRDEVAAERKSLLFEVNDGLGAVAARQTQQPCVDRRLREIRLVLERHHRNEPPRLTGVIGRPVSDVAARGTWQIALAGQALSHMSDKEKLAFSDSFANLELWERISIEEKAIWLRLAPLNLSDLLTQEDWSGIRSAYAQAVIYNDHIRVLAPWIEMQVSKNLPQVEKPRSADNLAAFNGMADEICKPALAPAASGGG